MEGIKILLLAVVGIGAVMIALGPSNPATAEHEFYWGGCISVWVYTDFFGNPIAQECIEWEQITIYYEAEDAAAEAAAQAAAEAAAQAAAEAEAAAQAAAEAAAQADAEAAAAQDEADEAAAEALAEAEAAAQAEADALAEEEAEEAEEEAKRGADAEIARAAEEAKGAEDAAAAEEVVAAEAAAVAAQAAVVAAAQAAANATVLEAEDAAKALADAAAEAAAAEKAKEAAGIAAADAGAKLAAARTPGPAVGGQPADADAPQVHGMSWNARVQIVAAAETWIVCHGCPGQSNFQRDPQTWRHHPGTRPRRCGYDRRGFRCSEYFGGRRQIETVGSVGRHGHERASWRRNIARRRIPGRGRDGTEPHRLRRGPVMASLRTRMHTKLPAVASLVALVFFAGPSWADFADGVAAYNRGDYEAALAEWRPLADQGNAIAQFSLGVLYEFGQGVPENPVAASLLYRLGAEQGNPFAQKALGVLYNAGRGVEKDEAEAVRWLRAAAEQDFAEAQFNLGMSYARGEGVARNSSEAYFWMSLAAADGLETANRVLSAIRRSLDPEQISAVDDRVNAWLDPARLADVTGPDIEIADTLETLEQTIVIGGLVRDANKIGAFTIQDVDVAVAENGAFATTIFVPLGGVTVRIAAIDEFGNQNERAVRVTHVQDVAEAALRFVALDPTARSSAPNANAVAIIIGVEGYQSLPAATYANRDAQMFFDFAQLALGIPVGNIRLLVDKEATDIEIFRAFQQWLPALVQPGETDVFVFFAGHGLAAADGS